MRGEREFWKLPYRYGNLGECVKMFGNSRLQHNVIIIGFRYVEATVRFARHLRGIHRLNAHERREDFDVRAKISVECALQNKSAMMKMRLMQWHTGCTIVWLNTTCSCADRHMLKWLCELLNIPWAHTQLLTNQHRESDVRAKGSDFIERKQESNQPHYGKRK